MLKFVVITFFMFSSKFESTIDKRIVQIEDVKVEFSENAIGIESGQPIFSKDTKIWVSNPTKTKINLFINDDEKEMEKQKIEISDLEIGTYTIMIVNASKQEEKRTVGFTIQ